MASVWVARLRGKRGFENLVAIKTILPQHAGDPAFERMFLDEARIMAGIRHPNVASVLDVGETRGLLYLAFEWVDGDQLSVLRRSVCATRKAFEVGVALRIMADACAGLHAAHELCDSNGASLKIVHRDVSPQNILVTTAGGVKVIDFGVAKALDRLAGETEVGVIKGKISYLAPELARCDAIDRRVDVWAAGVVLYELLAGRLPFDGETRAATVMSIVLGKRPPPLPKRVPAAVAAVVDQSLAAAPADRFRTAADLQRALEDVLAKEYGPVTGADVAACMAEHLGDQINERRRIIGGALEQNIEVRRAAASSADQDGSCPSVSIGETSWSGLDIPAADAERPETELASGADARENQRARLRRSVGFLAALIGTLAVVSLIFLVRAPGASPQPPASGATEGRAASAAPSTTAAEPTGSIAPLAEAAPSSVAPLVAAAAVEGSAAPRPRPLATAAPRNRASDPRVVFGSKR